MKLDLASLLGAGPSLSDQWPPDERAAPRALAPSPRGTSRPASSASRSHKVDAKSANRTRLAVTLPAVLADAARELSATTGEYLTDIVLEAVHHHGPSIVQMSRDRLANRLVATRRVSRQRNVIHPTLMILFVSVDEGAALDRQALDAQMTRSAFVATALTASLSVSLGL